MEPEKATLISGGGIFLLGLPSAGIFFGNWSTLYGASFFDTMDFLVSNWMLPLGGLAIAIYVGWFMKDEVRKEEFESGSSWGWMYTYWLWTLRILVPFLVMIVLLNKIEIISTARFNAFFGM